MFQEVLLVEQVDQVVEDQGHATVELEEQEHQVKVTLVEQVDQHQEVKVVEEEVEQELLDQITQQMEQVEDQEE
jgi:hypothetical protein